MYSCVLRLFWALGAKSPFFDEIWSLLDQIRDFSGPQEGSGGCPGGGSGGGLEGVWEGFGSVILVAEGHYVVLCRYIFYFFMV